MEDFSPRVKIVSSVSSDILPILSEKTLTEAQNVGLDTDCLPIDSGNYEIDIGIRLCEDEAGDTTDLSLSCESESLHETSSVPMEADDAANEPDSLLHGNISVTSDDDKREVLSAFQASSMTSMKLVDVSFQTFCVFTGQNCHKQAYDQGRCNVGYSEAE